VVTALNWTPTFEWYMARFAVENGHQEEIFFDEILLCSKYINHSRFEACRHNWEGLCDYLTI
jgi:hypothetical protein